METECGDCGFKLTEGQKECPSCHSTKKKFYLEVGNGIVVAEKELKIKAKDADGYRKFESTSRIKKAGKSGRSAKEELTFDHTDKKVTKKIHKVWERNEHGELEQVHDELIESPAKKRNPESDSVNS